LPVNVMAEGDETHGGERGGFSEGSSARSGRSEGDLLAERRARRAAESGELALTRRAEAAEATVQTLERHVASLQQRLRDAEDEQRLASELLEVEKAAALEREHELRRVKQREYAEQQLRVEAEERSSGSERESRAEIERIARRLSASEQDAAELVDALDGVQRQLAEAEHAADGERAALLADLRSVEHGLQARVGALELRAAELQQGLAVERAARERSERLLEGMREGHRQMASVLGDVRDLLGRLTIAAAAARASAPSRPPTAIAHVPAAEHAESCERSVPTESPPARTPAPPARTLGPEARGVEMADALAAAVERLRERAQAAPELQPETVAPPVVRVPHKHSMSLIGRWRFRRKQRRGS
jgi:hypothetical protein